MGANQSVHSTQEINDASRIVEKYPICTMNGQKTLTKKTKISATEEDRGIANASSNVVAYSDDEDDDEDSDDEEDGKALA
jgi:hypothetical protein